MGTHQSQKTLNRYEDPTRSMEEESQVLEIEGAHMWILGNGNGGKTGDTRYFSGGEQVIIVGRGIGVLEGILMGHEIGPFKSSF